jgi:hypothetical protein
MKKKLFYEAPGSELLLIRFEKNILSGADNRDMTPFHGDNDTAGDRDGGIGGNDYDL